MKHAYTIIYLDNYRCRKSSEVNVMAQNKALAMFEARQRLGYEIVIIGVQDSMGVLI